MQLTKIMSRTDICKDIFTYRFARCKENPHNYEDGKMYRELFDGDGVLSDKRNISFTLNTDGVPVFKSPPASMWPVYMCINELSPQLRMRKENMILAGLWFSKSKPEMATFLEPFVTALKEIEKGLDDKQ